MNSSLPQTQSMEESLTVFMVSPYMTKSCKFLIYYTYWLQRSVKVDQCLTVVRQKVVLSQSREGGKNQCSQHLCLRSGVAELFSFLKAQLIFYFLSGGFSYSVGFSKIKGDLFSSEFLPSSISPPWMTNNIVYGCILSPSYQMVGQLRHRAIFIYFGIHTNSLAQCRICRIYSINVCGMNGTNKMQKKAGMAARRRLTPCSNTISFDFIFLFFFYFLSYRELYLESISS